MSMPYPCESKKPSMSMRLFVGYAEQCVEVGVGVLGVCRGCDGR
jgi:hypothetical protein